MDSTESARSVNQGGGGGSGFISLALKHGGWIPPPGSGAFNLALWGMFLGIEPVTVRKRVREHRIPYRQLGNDMMIDTDDFLKSIPYANVDPQEE